jgi:hypothetical protein
MRHALMRGSDASPSSVIVGAEMRGHTAALRRHRQGKQIHLTAFVENGLRRFDHQFDQQSIRLESQR